VDSAPELERVLERLRPMVETTLDRLGEHLRYVVERRRAEIAPGDVHAERQGETGLEQPPLAEVENLLKAIALERELALVDQKPGVGTARCDLPGDLVEGELAVPEVAEHEAEREERRGHRPRHDDLDL